MDKRIPSSLSGGSQLRRRSDRLFSDTPVVWSDTTARSAQIIPGELVCRGDTRNDPYVKDLSPTPNLFSDVPLTPRLGDEAPGHVTVSDPSKFRMPSALSRLLPRSHAHQETVNSTHAPPVLANTSFASSNVSHEDHSKPTASRPKLVSNLSSTNTNFTQKWPKLRLNPRAIGGLVAALEESEGLGMNRIDRWTTYKWALLLSIIIAFIIAFVGLICAILTWFRGWEHADVMYIADGDILVLITLAASIMLLTALIGMCGTLLNSRPLLAIYSLMLWPSFISLAAIGYTTYKRSAFSLDRKLNLAWSQWYNPTSRLLIQDSLRCCGYYNSLHEATPSKQCFPRTTLPGCKGKLYRFESYTLETIWSTVFALVPVYLIIMFVSLLSSNHVTMRFGKGITPKRYRLNAEDVQRDENNMRAKFRESGVITRPHSIRSSTSAIFREDKLETRPLLTVDE